MVVVENLLAAEPNSDWDITASMLVSGTYDVLSYILIHLAFQVNGARHNPSRPANQLAKLIDNTIRNQITFTNYQRSQICKGWCVVG